MKKTIALILTLLLALSMLAACGKQESSDGEENYNTGDASMDDTRNQDGIGEDELLVVSFGTSFNDSRRLTIGSIESALAAAFPDWSVRRGFTSQIVIDHVLRRDGAVIDNVGEALDRAVGNGVKRLVVQPTHLMHGFEYTDLIHELAQYADAFDAVAVGEPLLNSDDDFSHVADAIAEATAEYDDGETAICFMGHGTEADSNAVYAKMQRVLDDKGLEHYYIGTVEAEPSVNDVLEAVQAGNYKKVVLEPLMIVAGDHANNDMAGDDADSWKSVFENAGYEVTCLLQGLGQLDAIQEIFVEHARSAMDTLPAAGDTSQAAGTEDRTDAADVAEAGMTPLYAGSLRDGTYPVEMKSSSSMFKADHCELVVSGGEMEAVLYMTSEAYGWMFAGTAEEAAQAAETAYIPLSGDGDMRTFTLPLKALDEGEAFAAYSRRKELWYDRTLLFRSDSLPLSAFADGILTTPESLRLADGRYTAEVTLSGGSGKAYVESPAPLTVTDGQCMATVIWSSSSYDYMEVDGERLLPVNTEGNSVFEIPVTAFDRPIAVLADTTAMSQPYEIAYTLRFDSSTVRPFADHMDLQYAEQFAVDFTRAAAPW